MLLIVGRLFNIVQYVNMYWSVYDNAMSDTFLVVYKNS